MDNMLFQEKLKIQLLILNIDFTVFFVLSYLTETLTARTLLDLLIRSMKVVHVHARTEQKKQAMVAINE